MTPIVNEVPLVQIKLIMSTEVHFDNGQESMSDVLMHPGDNVKLFGNVHCDFNTRPLKKTWTDTINRVGDEQTEAVCTVAGASVGRQLQGKVTKVYNGSIRKENHWAFETNTDTFKIACNQAHHVFWNEKAQTFQCSKGLRSTASIDFHKEVERTDEFVISDNGSMAGVNIEYKPTSGAELRGVVVDKSKGNVQCEMNGDAQINCSLDRDASMNVCYNHENRWGWPRECVAFKNKTEQPQTVRHSCNEGVWAYRSADYSSTRPPNSQGRLDIHEQLYCVHY